MSGTEQQGALAHSERTEESVQLTGLAADMGMKVVDYSRDHVRATMPVEGNRQPFGLMHGGAYVVLGETLGSMHANLLAPEGHIAVGVDVNATHTGSAVEGLVYGECRPLHVGRSLAVHEIVITNEAGQRCSTIRITNFYKLAPKQR